MIFSEVLHIRYRCLLTILTALTILLLVLSVSMRQTTVRADAAVTGSETAEAVAASEPEPQADTEPDTEERAGSITMAPEDIFSPEQTGLALYITADPEDLFGYENGIFIEGKLREEWQAANPDAEPSYDSPANYNIRGRESERPVHMTLYEDGVCLLDQDCGIRIAGHFTRQSEQKSFRLYARTVYSDPKRFEAPLFEDQRSPAGGTMLSRYKTLKIRNGGNDRSEGFIRDELALTLAGMAGMENTQSVRPVSVWINQEYQGFYWMHSDYDETWFSEKYGDYEGEMVIIGDGEQNMKTDSADALVNQYAEEYMELYARFAASDLTDDAVCARLNRFLDLENYLRYYAIQIYVGNQDWPWHNLEAFRYVSPDGVYQEGTVFDGRYRYLLYDMDTTMGLGFVADTLEADYSLQTLVRLLENDYSPLFEALMKREDCRLFFSECLCELANGAFHPQNVEKVLNEMDDLRREQLLAYVAYTQETDSLPDLSEYYLQMQKDTILAWADTTFETLLTGVGNLLGTGTPFPVSMELPEDCGALINTLRVEGNFTGAFLSGCPLAIRPLLPDGKVFAGWEVNGSICMQEELLLTAPSEGGLSVRLLTADSGGGLSLCALRSGSFSDYILLINTSDQPVSTEGYYLMDKQKVSHMNYLDPAILSPGETLLIGCKNYQGDDAFMTVNFNLKKGETLRLGHHTDQIVDCVFLPKMGSEDSVYKKDPLTGIWSEYRK